MAGSIAGGLSRTVAAPLETVRVRLMTGAATGTGSMASPSILGMLRDIAKHEGVRALWKGNAAVVARFAPTKGLDFFTFNLYKGAHALRDPVKMRRQAFLAKSRARQEQAAGVEMHTGGRRKKKRRPATAGAHRFM